jgi:hypothetical protein
MFEPQMKESREVEQPKKKSLTKNERLTRLEEENRDLKERQKIVKLFESQRLPAPDDLVTSTLGIPSTFPAGLPGPEDKPEEVALARRHRGCRSRQNAQWSFVHNHTLEVTKLGFPTCQVSFA